LVVSPAQNDSDGAMVQPRGGPHLTHGRRLMLLLGSVDEPLFASAEMSRNRWSG